MSPSSQGASAVSVLDAPTTRWAVTILLLTVLLALSMVSLSAEADGPPLEVDSPADGLVTTRWTIPVSGTTAPDTPVVVHAEWGWDECRNQTTSLSDGTFEAWIQLGWNRNLLTVEAGDGVNGTTAVTRNVTLDLTRPYLEAWIEFINHVPVRYSDEMEAYVVADMEVLVNGTCYDDTTPDEDLLVRVNGEVVTPGPDRRGDFLARVELSPGPNDIVVDVTDVVGWQRAVTLRVLRDTEPPPVSVRSPVDEVVTRDPTCVVEGLTEPVTYVKVTVQHPGGRTDHTTTSGAGGVFSVTVQLAEGSQVLTVFAVDDVGNMNSTALAVTLDTTPPDLVVDSPPGGTATTRDDSYAIVARLADGQDAVVSVGDLEVEGTDLFRLEVDLQRGENTFEVRAVDVAGNQRAVTVTIWRDTYPPSLVLTSPRDLDLLTNDPTVVIAGTVEGAEGVTVRDRGVPHQALLTAGTWEDGEWECVLDLGEQDAERDLEVYALDEAGNRDGLTIHVVLDTTPPPLEIEGGPRQVTNRGPFRLRGTTGSGPVDLTVDGEGVPAEAGAFNATLPLEEGVNTFLVLARDRAGNEASIPLEVTLDTVPPDLDLHHPRSTDRDTVRVTGTTDADVVTVYVDGRAFPVDNGTFGFTIELVGEGVHPIEFTVEDAAGNRRTQVIEVEYRSSMPGPGPIAALMALVTAALVARRERPGPG